MFKLAFVILAFVYLGHSEAKILKKDSYDPPSNPLHFVKLAAKKPPQLASKWTSSNDPGYYTDSFARNKMYYLAAGSYANDPLACLSSKFKNVTVVKHVVTFCEMSTTRDKCAGYTAVSHSDKAIMMAFRGTQGFLELVDEIDHVILKRKKPSPVGGKIAYYFYSVFEQLWNMGLQESFVELLNQHPDYEIWLTGHSLGGAVASIAGTWVLNEYKVESERIKLITFGQPRTGDTQYAIAHNQKLPRSYRVTHQKDIVPHIPPEKFESFFHHGSEIWYPKGMAESDKFIVCNDGESNQCSDKQFLDTSVHDHLLYFERLLSDFGSAGCVDLIKERARKH